MNFAEAIEALKNGERVARFGWNGKKMFVYLDRGSSPTVMKGHHLIDGISSSLFDLGDAGTTIRLPNLNMRTATGATATGWLASQTDMLAEDWEIV